MACLAIGDFEWIAVWEHWWSGCNVAGLTVYNVKVFWLARIGKIATYLAGLVVLIDIVGERRLKFWAIQLKRLSRKLFRRVRALFIRAIVGRNIMFWLKIFGAGTFGLIATTIGVELFVTIISIYLTDITFLLFIILFLPIVFWELFLIASLSLLLICAVYVFLFSALPAIMLIVSAALSHRWFLISLRVASVVTISIAFAFDLLAS